MQFCVCVDQNPFRSQTLRALRGNGVAMIEVPHFHWVERDNLTVVHADCDVAVSRKVFDCAQRPVGKIELPQTGSQVDRVRHRLSVCTASHAVWHSQFL